MKPNRERLKRRLALRHIRAIRNAIVASVDVNSVTEAWFQAHHPDIEGVRVTTAQAQDWAMVNVIVETKPIRDVLTRIYADAYVLGEAITNYEIAKLMIKKELSRDEVAQALRTNWANWTPGNKPAALLMRKPTALDNLISSGRYTSDEITRTTVKRIGTILGNALERGLAPSQVSILLDELLDDPVRALTIAQTEMSRSVVQASKQLYQESGVEMVEWLVADPCDECQENYNQSPIQIGDQWVNGDPPVHPNCMCDIAPYVVDTGLWAWLEEEE